jgi:hydrogenase nickel incorporation protein HypA/HybF
MHELAVCQQLLLQVDQIAKEQNARLVESITLRIGPLSGVEAHLLTQAFPLAAAGSIAQDAELIIESLPIRVRCQTCGAETDALPNKLVCGACGDYHTQLISGDEMLLASLSLMSENEETENV